MTRQALIREAQAILAEAYEAAAEMIVLYLDDHPSEQLQTLCKEIDPDNWDALRKRVQRAQVRMDGAWEEGAARTRANRESAVRHTKVVLAQATPAQIQELVESLPPRQREKVAKAATAALPAYSGSKTGPLDISHLPKTGEAKLNRWIQEGKDLWAKHGDELSPSKRRRFVDKISGLVAKIASEDIEYV